MPTLVTPHFSVEEFACRDGTPYPPQWVEARLAPLCQALEVLRSANGAFPMTVHSGYRTAAYNGHIGASNRSQHLVGRAADVSVPNTSAPELYALISRLVEADKLLPKDQQRLAAIGGLGSYPSFIHIDVRLPIERRPGNRIYRWVGTRPANPTEKATKIKQSVASRHRQ